MKINSFYSILFFLLLVCLFVVVIFVISNSAYGLPKVEIITPEEYIIWPLGKDSVFLFECEDHYLEITIKQKMVSVTKSSCANQICVKTGRINRTGQLITCAPNKVIVRLIRERPSRNQHLLTY